MEKHKVYSKNYSDSSLMFFIDFVIPIILIYQDISLESHMLGQSLKGYIFMALIKIKLLVQRMYEIRQLCFQVYRLFLPPMDLDSAR